MKNKTLKNVITIDIQRRAAEEAQLVEAEDVARKARSSINCFIIIVIYVIVYPVVYLC